MLRFALACALCVSAAGAARAQAPAQLAPAPGQAWPAPSAPWYGPPQGPVYVSPVDYELWQIDRELARLHAARPRMFWPIALTAAGGAMTLSGALGMIMLSTSWTEHGYRVDEEGNQVPYTYTNPADRELMKELAIVTAVGAGLLAGGLVMLVPRVRKRRLLKEQAEPLRQRRLQLLGGHPSLSFDAGGVYARTRFTF